MQCCKKIVHNSKRAQGNEKNPWALFIELVEGEARGVAIGEARGVAKGKTEGIAIGATRLAELIKSGLSVEEAIRIINEELQ